MKTINYYLQAFGFENSQDYFKSTFGFLLSIKVITWSAVIGSITTFLENSFGLPIAVFLAFVFLNILEFFTGIEASKKKGKPVESRKMGRMFLKIGTYVSILLILNAFDKGIQIPDVLGINIQPFTILKWTFLAGLIYQLYISLLENLEALGYKEIVGVLRFTKKKIGNTFDESNNTQ